MPLGLLYYSAWLYVCCLKFGVSFLFYSLRCVSLVSLYLILKFKILTLGFCLAFLVYVIFQASVYSGLLFFTYKLFQQPTF